MGKYRDGRKNQNNEVSKFICTWPAEVHALIKMHSKMKNETINEWVVKAVLDQLGRENSFVSGKKE